ncbi:hypothetical protein HDU76_005852 [Blyttiomyces sp. JEL0837]|nr:hypothetical protein HDU76_005852 [Blyttiomyces sp. JEL0837]
MTMFSSILYFAADRGYMNIIQFILAKVNIDDNTNVINQPQHERAIVLNELFTTGAITKAFENGHLEILKLLSTLDEQYPVFNNLCVPKAVKHHNVIKFLYSKIPSSNFTDLSREALTCAAEGGHIETVNVLLSTIPDVSGVPDINRNFYHYNQALMGAAKNGHFEVLKLLLTVFGAANINRIDPNDVYLSQETVLTVAAASGHFDIVNHLVMEEGIDPSGCNNHALRRLVAGGHLEAVKLFLTFPGVDPTACNDDELRDAAGGGHLEVLKFMLINPPGVAYIPGVFPTAEDNDAVKRAALAGHGCLRLFERTEASNEQRHFKSAKIWLRHCNITASSISEQAMMYAAMNGRVDVVEYVMNLHGIDTTEMGKLAVAGAVNGRPVDWLGMLITKFGCDPSTDVDSYALLTAARKGYVEIVKLLLACPREKALDRSMAKYGEE